MIIPPYSRDPSHNAPEFLRVQVGGWKDPLQVAKGRASEIPQAIVDQVLALEAKGLTRPEISKIVGKKVNCVTHIIVKSRGDR